MLFFFIENVNIQSTTTAQPVETTTIVTIVHPRDIQTEEQTTTTPKPITKLVQSTMATTISSTVATIVQAESKPPVHPRDIQTEEQTTTTPAPVSKLAQLTTTTTISSTVATIVQAESKPPVHPRDIQTEEQTTTTPAPVSKLAQLTTTTTISSTVATIVQAESKPPVHPRDIQIEEQTTTTPTPVTKLAQSTMERTISSTVATIVQTEQKHPVHPRDIQTEDLVEQTIETPIINPKLILKSDEILIKKDNLNNLTMLTNKTRQICWHLPKTFEPSIQLLENQILRFINLLPDFLQTIFFGRIDDREILLNTMWLSSICTMCGLFSFLFLSMGTKRLQQTKQEKEVRVRCQQLQQTNNQIELERATFERQNLKLTFNSLPFQQSIFFSRLSEQIDELKCLTVRDSDEELYALRTVCQRYQEELQTACYERDNFKRELELKQNLIRKYENDAHEQSETISNLNYQVISRNQKFHSNNFAILDCSIETRIG